MNIREKLKSGRIYLDGGMGTLLQARGLKAGELPERWNIERPEEIERIHSEYLEAGCDVITANTFGANILKFNQEELSEIITNGVKIAKAAAEGYSGTKERYTALDIGPTGRLLKPLGDLDFEDAVKVFSKTVKIGVSCGVDLILIETMNDSYETRAAVLAAKENSTLPIFVTNTFDEGGKLMTGADVETMVTLLEGLSVDALGINCGLGPDKMMNIVDDFVKYSSTPLIVNPNAGLPKIENGKTVFDVTPEDFSKYMREIAKKGVMIMGGCCGTTPGHIRELIKNTEDIKYKAITEKNETKVSSYTKTVSFSDKPVLIGERINPTGKPLFKAALKNSDYDYILKEGISQEEAGAQILDVNVGLPEIDEPFVLEKTVKLLQSVTDLPLQLDTSDTEAMEKALRIYNGKALINSVNGKKEVMDKIFPLVKKYGGTLIALTLDEEGIPENADGRIKIAEKIIKEAERYGILPKDIIVDPLAMTISADTSSALTTLEAIRRLSQKGIKTSLGVSNVSFGLPRREFINSTFFAITLTNGLSAAIMNPHSDEMMRVYKSFLALSGLDDNCQGYIEYASAQENEPKEKEEVLNPLDGLKKAITKGLLDEGIKYTEKLMGEKKALDIINEAIIPALNNVGKAFEEKRTFLPQLLMSAECAKGAFDLLKKSMIKDGEEGKDRPKIVLATVKGDIHDIGKNIVKVLLQNYDFNVFDLGKDVEPSLIVRKSKEENVKLVGLSALMTTTVPSMEETIKLLKEELPDVSVMVGGAVLTEEYADMIGADKYVCDAMESVRYAEEILR